MPVKKRIYTEEEKKKSREAYRKKHPNCVPRLGKYTFHKTQKSRKDKKESSRLLYRYGITLDQYKDISKSQNDLCKICEQPESFKSKLAVDHCHKTGKVRGLLCFKCNAALGKFEQNPELLLKAFNYIKEAELCQG